MYKSYLNLVWSNRTREMAQWVAYLLYKNEEMSLNLQNINLDMIAHIYPVLLRKLVVRA